MLTNLIHGGVATAAQIYDGADVTVSTQFIQLAATASADVEQAAINSDGHCDVRSVSWCDGDVS